MVGGLTQIRLLRPPSEPDVRVTAHPALRETPAGHTLVSIPLIRLSGRSVRANLTLDEGVAAFIDAEARRRGMTRTAYVEWMARRIAQAGG